MCMYIFIYVLYIYLSVLIGIFMYVYVGGYSTPCACSVFYMDLVIGHNTWLLFHLLLQLVLLWISGLLCPVGRLPCLVSLACLDVLGHILWCCARAPYHYILPSFFGPSWARWVFQVGWSCCEVLPPVFPSCLPMWMVAK